eukprot:CAMPEP_0118714498 /NCGR_PEP_ID=MMETSP0800-20121206/26227_1 /TAXON_ID=210618 ORGANISM="Striatella unipunctata, Strain CCMP2910" /NCGR_SAMPLE_ID=MMETSP0800 /ASSEMBLY_ACC=CAM_ASM_000638 /LENGTH=71 /DNA_ID=CAMNT_0006620311 /DNA_START=151 /DNA_END=366 /DNA_ORIENTATION=+
MKNAEKQGSAPPEFMSTHPSYDSRLSNFDKWIPELNLRDHDIRCARIREDMVQARKVAAQAARARQQQTAR